MFLPTKSSSPFEIYSIIKDLNPKKAPGYDQITGKILQELPRKALVFLSRLFNAIFRLQYFPEMWKAADVIMIAKPGKPGHEVTSYRPISLLPTLSKVFEKILAKRLKPLLCEFDIIPQHQFGFRAQHATIEQVHRIAHAISTALEEKKYVSAVFLDVSQAFDKVWHTGLLYQIKNKIQQFYLLLKSYLENRRRKVKFQGDYSDWVKVTPGVPQECVFGPMLYCIYKADLPMQ